MASGAQQAVCLPAMRCVRLMSLELAGHGSLQAAGHPIQLKPAVGSKPSPQAAGQRAGVAPTLIIYLPTTASPSKVAKLQEGGATVVLHGTDCVEVSALAAGSSCCERQQRTKIMQCKSTTLVGCRHAARQAVC